MSEPMTTKGAAQRAAGAKGVVLTPEQQRSRRARNIAIGVAIALLAALFYAVTVVKLGGAIANRTL